MESDMNALTKILAPLALVATAATAQAGIVNIDYPSDVIAQHSAVASTTSAAAASGGVALNLIHSESAALDAQDGKATQRTRAEVQKEAQSTGWSRSYNYGDVQ